MVEIIKTHSGGWRNSVVFKIFAVSFVCIHLPLLALLATVGMTAFDEHGTLVIAVLIATLVGTAACLAFMWRLILPLKRLADAITRYRISGEFLDGDLDKRGENEIGVVTRAVCGMVGEIAVLAERLEYRPAKDPLTGLLNSSAVYDDYFDDVAGVDAQDGPLSLVMFEIDRFAEFRRMFGREVTDRLLVEVGDLVRSAMGAETIAARMSGGTFLMVMPGASREEVAGFCGAFRRRVEEIELGPLQKGSVTASFGISRRGPDTPVAEAIHRADMALYQAKDTGRSVVGG